MSRSRVRTRGGVILAGLIWLCAAPAAGQEVARAVLEGRVQAVEGSALDDLEVILHRVTVEEAGEIDTTRVDATGAFRFDLPTVPDPGGRGEVYFASAEHQGVVYFGPAIHLAVQLDSAYVIEVYDTLAVSSAAADLATQARYVIVEPARGGWDVTDLFQLGNAGQHTLVAGDGAVWSHPLPRNASEAQPMQEGGGVEVTGGEIRVTAPIPPGARQYAVRYSVPGPPLELPLGGPVHAMEVLVAQAAPPLNVSRLTASQPVELQAGAVYRRYVGTQLAGGTVLLELGDGASGLPVRGVAVFLAMVLAAGGLWAVRVRARPVPVAVPAGDSDERSLLVLEAARLDAALESETDDERRAALAAERARLVERIRALG